MFGLKKNSLTAEAVRGALADIVDLERVSGIHIAADKAVSFLITVEEREAASFEPVREQAEKAVAALAGVRKVTAILTAERKAPTLEPAAAAQAPDPHGMNKNPPLTLPIKNIIAVASGKGGVGKSMVAMNLAVSLAKQGKSVGLLDADIYGPSVPKMTGLEGQKPEFDANDKIIPLSAHGLKVMSIGFMVNAEEALVWRGPMVQSAIYQMLRDVKWAEEGKELDVLVVDMPPGTGDAQLTLAQKVPVTGAVIVSTPQDIALIDARKAVEMFRKVDMPILGLIENMSMYVCSACGHEEPSFGHGGARKEAEELGIPFLGDIPLSLDIRLKADAGEPMGLPAGILKGLTLKD